MATTTGANAFTFADTKEVWHFEITGRARVRIGAVWPPSGSRRRDRRLCQRWGASGQIDLGNAEYFMASANVTALAEEMGFWSKGSGRPFEFCYALQSGLPTSVYCRRREWRVLSLLAPSLQAPSRIRELPFLGQAG